MNPVSKLKVLGWFNHISPLEWLTQHETFQFVPSLGERKTPTAREQAISSVPKPAYALSFAASEGEIAEAQRLRFKVFAEEMGAKLPNASLGHDIDEYDAHCEHLLVRDTETGRVVGAYRLLPPENARRLGRFYAESEFDLTRIVHLRNRTVEAGRSCVHWEHRNGAVIMLLWSGIARFMRRYGYEYLIGCASMSLRDGGHGAANVYSTIKPAQFTAPEYRVFPHVPLPVAQLVNGDPAEPPPLVKGYLRAGAKVGGAPAWDPDFNCADFFVMLPIAELNPRYARHFA